MSTPNLARAVLEALTAGGVDFVVCGGVAVILQGIARRGRSIYATSRI